jgi:hypothetical protein
VDQATGHQLTERIGAAPHKEASGRVTSSNNADRATASSETVVQRRPRTSAMERVTSRYDMEFRGIAPRRKAGDVKRQRQVRCAKRIGRDGSDASQHRSGRQKELCSRASPRWNAPSQKRQGKNCLAGVNSISSGVAMAPAETPERITCMTATSARVQ